MFHISALKYKWWVLFRTASEVFLTSNSSEHWHFYSLVYHMHVNVKVPYLNDPRFSVKQVWANSADPDQTAPRGAV